MESHDVHPLGPFDITLLAKDGKEFKAHRRVLSEASPFFEKLLESDMKENREGVVRLVVLTELLMKEILGFIYTGDVQILSEENAEELIMAGDYLFLPNLKAVAGRFLEDSMTTSNCVSTYYFAETYRCDELTARAKTFIQSNFVIVTKSVEFLNLSSKEVEDWISSDGIVINAEKDVFNIILRWIAKEQEMRNGKFQELFRHVRLIFASRDFLVKELVTNDFVQQNESCMSRVTQAMNWIDRSPYHDPPSPKSPRKIFGPDVLLAYRNKKRGGSVACYLPDENKWYQLPKLREIENEKVRRIIPYDGKLYAVTDRLRMAECYEPVLNKWTSLEWLNSLEFIEPNKRVSIRSPAFILAANGQIYAVVQVMVDTFSPPNFNFSRFLAKYNMVSHSWQLLACSFLAEKWDVGAVAFNKYIYFVGGCRGDYSQQFHLNDAARFDTVSNTWEEIAAMQEARSYAFGAAANEKVYIAGGFGADYFRLKSCEVYNEMTNEWCFIASLTVPRVYGSMVCVDGTLYVLGGHDTDRIVECYDYRKDEWKKKTTLPWPAPPTSSVHFLNACSARLFKPAFKVKHARRRPVQDCAIT
ncbi:kelch-like protein 21 [Oculina patagonica]